ncbi:MAG: hypothetical protein AVDCRST_MAG74-447 [uncultured Pyrinomonadaceae bacterium]|uniref:Uncharacterized protein n=1 Tax=uncultured Pyrinomonadaceae bacterium TaxID=2283094 RepID=A0A6J4N7E3_9BACT|nr:MAG: hypothetical protein AVDCRST_MAG74-447 [uncultured Pyrinomonadaceae bacterium]
MSATKEQQLLPKSVQTRQIKVGKWNESLKKSDVNQIWTELHRIVSSHPLVRASKRAGFLVEEGRHNAYTDLTQELFVALLGKERFAHYIDTGMTDAEVEAEISQIELTNMLTAELRKRYPESYRLARRVSTLIQTGKTFKRFDNINSPDVHRRLADRLYGLAEWKNEKTRRNVQEMEERVKIVSFQSRDTRMVGCTGDAQIVISNVELEKLIVRVFKAIDSPVDVRSLRSFVMSRLPIMDIYLVPVGGGGSDNGEEDKMEFDFADTRENPEENVLRREGELTAASFVDDFLNNLNKSVRGKTKQYNRMINVLWYCYLISDSGTQLEVAEMLGVSDSLVSDYRKRIEANLQQLSFNGVNEARQFEKALRRAVREIIAVEKAEKVSV